MDKLLENLYATLNDTSSELDLEKIDKRIILFKMMERQLEEEFESRIKSAREAFTESHNRYSAKIETLLNS